MTESGTAYDYDPADTSTTNGLVTNFVPVAALTTDDQGNPVSTITGMAFLATATCIA